MAAREAMSAFLRIAFVAMTGFGNDDRHAQMHAAVLMIVASLTTAYVGSFLREPFCGLALNRWDETLAHCCLGYLALIVT